jgi:hypothetical protein
MAVTAQCGVGSARAIAPWCLALALATAVGCGDSAPNSDDGGAAPIDSGAMAVDAGDGGPIVIDAAVADAVAADASSCVGDAGVACDHPLAPVCDELSGGCVQCVVEDDCASFDFRDICVPAENVCVECENITDCADDPTALGPACDPDARTCFCNSTAECADNRNGPICDNQARACTCNEDEDCDEDQTCTSSPYIDPFAKTCKPAEPPA